MKKFLTLFFFPTLFILSCNNGNDDSEDGNSKLIIPQEIKTYNPLDLSEWGLDVMLYVPDSSVGLPQVSINNANETEVKVGDYYQIAILEGGDLELKKADLKEDLLFKCAIVQEDSTSILYYAQLPDGSKTFYHFYAIVKINDINYELHDIETGEVMPEKAASRMLTAAKFLQPKKATEVTENKIQ